MDLHFVYTRQKGVWNTGARKPENAWVGGLADGVSVENDVKTKSVKLTFVFTANKNMHELRFPRPKVRIKKNVLKKVQLTCDNSNIGKCNIYFESNIVYPGIMNK